MATKKQANKPQTLCTVCGKPLKVQGSTCGARCTTLQKQGYTVQKKLQLKACLSFSNAPAGYITIAKLHTVCVANYIPVSKMVKQSGSDGVTSPPAHPITTPVFVNGTRWLPGWLATKQGLQAIQSNNFANAPVQGWQKTYYNYVLACQTAILANKKPPVKPQLQPAQPPNK